MNDVILLSSLGIPFQKSRVLKADVNPKLNAFFNDCMSKMQIKNPPRIVIVEDETWQKLPKYIGAAAAATPQANTVIICEKIASIIENGNDDTVRFLCAHEVGHIADYQQSVPSRRNILTGGIAAASSIAILGGYFGYKAIDVITSKDTSAWVTAPARTLSTTTGAVTGFAASKYALNYTISRFAKRDELQADLNAAKIIGLPGVINGWLEMNAANMKLAYQAADENGRIAIQKSVEEKLPQVRAAIAPYSDFIPNENQRWIEGLAYNLACTEKVVPKRLSTISYQNGSYPSNFERILGLCEIARNQSIFR